MYTESSNLPEQTIKFCEKATIWQATVIKGLAEALPCDIEGVDHTGVHIYTPEGPHLPTCGKLFSPLPEQPHRMLLWRNMIE